MEFVTELASDIDVALAAAAAGAAAVRAAYGVGADQETQERVVQLVAPHFDALSATPSD